MFKIGQKVVCINSEGTGDEIFSRDQCAILAVGTIYTVRWIGIFHFHGGEKLGVRLQEVMRDWPLANDKGGDGAYGSWRFRPLIENKRETDIAVFKKLLNPIRQKEDA